MHNVIHRSTVYHLILSAILWVEFIPITPILQMKIQSTRG